MKQRKRHLPPEFLAPLTPCNLPVQRCPVPREKATKRILIMRLGAYGDILMGTPLLTALRRNYPDAHITWIVEHTALEAIDAHPFIDEVIVWDGSYWKQMIRKLQLHLWLPRTLGFRRELKRRCYDIFISFQPEEWPLLLKGVDAPVTIGVFDTFRQFSGETKTSPRKKLYTNSFAYPDLPEHRTDQYLLPLRTLGILEPVDKKMQIGITAEDMAVVQDFLTSKGLPSGKPFIVFAPMTTWPSRCWPKERYAHLGDILASQKGLGVVIIGSSRQAEESAVAAIVAQMEITPISATGVFSFRQMAALIAQASVLVSGDTGPMHVAAAVGTPYVALFGPTPVVGRAPLTGPGLTLMHPVPCGPCDQKICPNPPESHMLCMNLITVDEVAAAVIQNLNLSASAE